MSPEIDLETLEKVIDLMISRKLSHLEVSDIKITRTHHEEQRDFPAPQLSTKTQEEIDDELLFYSTS